MMLYKRWWLWDYLFSGHQWYRKWCGGHWEQWCNTITHSDMWFQMDGCSLSSGYRPGGCFGTPSCEDYDVAGPKAEA